MSLKLENIYKHYGKKEVLTDLNLEFEEGKIYGLIGRNGAGKTTLLSIASAQNPASAGKITLDDREVWENQEALNDICFSREIQGICFGKQNTYKVKDYLKMAGALFPHWDNEMAEQLLEEFELDRKQKIYKLSKGMMSMITIIVALASKAKYTFLDEPVAGLDVVARENFYRLLLDEYSETGRTFVISTHIIEEASDVFEEVVFIKKGTVLIKENTQEMLERFVHVSGLEELVNEATGAMKTYHKEKLGRSKGITVATTSEREKAKLAEYTELSVQKMNLQDIFVSLCGREES